MSRKNEEKVVQQISLRLSTEERDMLDELARRDDRDMTKELKWMIKAYYRGELILKSTVDAKIAASIHRIEPTSGQLLPTKNESKVA